MENSAQASLDITAPPAQGQGLCHSVSPTTISPSSLPSMTSYHQPTLPQLPTTLPDYSYYDLHNHQNRQLSPVPPPETKAQHKPLLFLKPDQDEYSRDVLQLDGNQTEAELDEQLKQRAALLGLYVERLRWDSDRESSSAAASAVGLSTSAQHGRTASNSSKNSGSTALTTNSSAAVSTSAAIPIQPRAIVPSFAMHVTKNLSFSQYDKNLSQLDPNIMQPRIQTSRASIDLVPSHGRLFSSKIYKLLKHELKTRVRWMKRPSPVIEPTITCICCREDFLIDKTHLLQILPCGHTYCTTCLHVIITQAATDEFKMPPRCCIQPIPGSIIQAILTNEEQQAFLKAVLQFSTPWEARMFCPNAACGEFIPTRNRVDLKHPSEVMCHKCKRRVCTMCKHDAHALGQDCPHDRELDVVLRIGEKRGWRRCYKCRNLVELSVGCTHMTCRCKAQFCYICGAVWDQAVGCPNFCNGEEVLYHRQMEEQARIREADAKKAAEEAAAAVELVERFEAERRTQERPEFSRLLKRQSEEMSRFVTYEKILRRNIRLECDDLKKILAKKYEDLTDKMKGRHARTAAHLEDRQIAGEMELRNTLEYHERSVQIRLKHMEAYCASEGTSPDSQLPPRVVTERDRRELSQQYNVREGMERLHQAKINVMRDRQAKKMEELLERQAAELQKHTRKHEEEVENLAAQFAHNQDSLVSWLEERKGRLRQRWELSIEIMRVELEQQTRFKFASAAVLEWPTSKSIVKVQAATG